VASASKRLLYQGSDRARAGCLGETCLKKPLQVLQGAIGRPVTVELRGQVAFRGVLDGFDPHMNLVLTKAREFQDGKESASSERAVIRGDSVIYIST